MADSESDIELRTVPLKKKTKTVTSPSSDVINNNKKITMKLMIFDALTELKSRKGTSLQAIKKHLTGKYQVDTEKLNYLIKKSIKSCVEDSTIVQLKGIGASGSFKLANTKPIKKRKSKKEPKTDIKDDKKTVEKTKEKKDKVVKTMPDKSKEKKMAKPKKVEERKPIKKKVEKKDLKEKKEEEGAGTKEEKMKKSKVKAAKSAQTPAKKQKLIMKRKSIGSIIRKPKMKPTK